MTPRRHRHTVGRLLLGPAMLATVLGGCAEEAPAMPDDPLPAAFEDDVPAPTGEVVLTVTNEAGTTDWDMATLRMLPQHELTVVEPFLEEELTFEGPLWADVLRASDVELGGDGSVELVALDDYVADIPTAAETLDGLVLALRQGGEPIPVAEGGPLRLVYPPGNPTGENVNSWIWSIRSATAG